MTASKIKIGIVGYGFIGTTLNEWLKQSNPDVETRTSDPPKDVDAFEKMFRYTPLGKLLNPLKKLNDDFRDK